MSGLKATDGKKKNWHFFIYLLFVKKYSTVVKPLNFLKSSLSPLLTPKFWVSCVKKYKSNRKMIFLQLHLSVEDLEI